MALTPTQLQELQDISVVLAEEFPSNVDSIWDTAIRFQLAGIGPLGVGGLPVFEAAVADLKLTQEQLQTVQGRNAGESSGYTEATLEVVPSGGAALPMGLLGEVIYIDVAPSTYLATSVLSLTPAGPNSVILSEVAAAVARTVPPASGGIEVNNLLTGAGFERVLTTADITAMGGQVDSVVGGTNISVNAGDPINPIVNLDAAITGVSVDGVTLSAVGAATNFLNEAGAYSVPPSAVTPPAGADTQVQFNNMGAFDASAALRWDYAIDALRIAPGASGGVIFSIAANEVGLSYSPTSSTNYVIWRAFDQSFGFFFELRHDYSLSSANHRLQWRNQAGISGQFLEFDNSDEMRIMGSESTEQCFINKTGTFAIRNDATLYLEQTAVNANITGHGQLWVNSADDSLNYRTEAGVDFDLTASSPVTQIVDGSGNIAVIADGLGLTGVRSVGNTDAEDRGIQWEFQDGTVRASIGNEFFTDLIYRNHIAGRHHIFRVGIGGGNRIRLHLDGDQTIGGCSLYAGSSATPRLQTLNHGVEVGNGTLFLVEQAAQEADIVGQGQLWVNSADDSLNYITEAGVVFDLTNPPAGSLTPWVSDIDADGFDLDDLGVIFMREQAASDPDVPTQGQLWVRDDSFANTLMFTTGQGNEYEVAGIPYDGDLLDGAGSLSTTTFVGWVNIGPKPNTWYTLICQGQAVAPAADDVKVQLTVDTNSIFQGLYVDSNGQQVAMRSAIGEVVTNTVVVDTDGSATDDGTFFTITGALKAGATGQTVSLRAAKNADTGADGFIYFPTMSVVRLSET